MYYVYIIQSEKDQSYYIGQTRDIDERLLRHNSGREQYTKVHLPWKLVYSEHFQTRLEAIRREREIKKKKSRKYIENLVRVSSQLGA